MHTGVRSVASDVSSPERWLIEFCQIQAVCLAKSALAAGVARVAGQFPICQRFLTGASTMTICRPSILGSCSTVP